MRSSKWVSEMLLTSAAVLVISACSSETAECISNDALEVTATDADGNALIGQITISTV